MIKDIVVNLGVRGDDTLAADYAVSVASALEVSNRSRLRPPFRVQGRPL
jgi:hypothetical protein